MDTYYTNWPEVSMRQKDPVRYHLTFHCQISSDAYLRIWQPYGLNARGTFLPNCRGLRQGWVGTILLIIIIRQIGVRVLFLRLTKYQMVLHHELNRGKKSILPGQCNICLKGLNQLFWFFFQWSVPKGHLEWRKNFKKCWF